MTTHPSSGVDPCPTRDRLVGFYQGRLPVPALETIANHLADCGRCVETLRVLDSTPAGNDLAGQLAACLLSPGAGDEPGWHRLEAAVEGLLDTGYPTVREGTWVEEECPWVGRQVGFYEILEELGRGGMGVVFRARHRLIDREVALKMILAGPFAAREHRARFRIEGKAAARLNHPAIVRVHDFAEHEGLPYYAMELVRGETLAARLKRGPLPPREAAELLIALARAVEYAHQNKVVHRDLKPGNILLCRKAKSEQDKAEQAAAVSGLPSDLVAACEPKVTDFGLAKLLDEGAQGHTEAEDLLGTPAYMAPEQAEGGRNEIGQAVDIWALGVILYECLTGRQPFRKDSREATLALVRQASPQRPSFRNPVLPPELDDICLKCLKKLPSQRYGSAEALAVDLERWLVGLRPSVTPSRARRMLLRLRETARAMRRPACLAVGAGLALALAAHLSLPASRSPEPDQVSLEQLEQNLDRRRPVNLITTDRGPVWHRWLNGHNEAQTTLEPDGSFTINAWSYALLELLPDPRSDYYCFKARVKHLRSDRVGDVGLFLNCDTTSRDGLDVHSFVLLLFNDIRSGLEQMNGVVPLGATPPGDNAVQMRLVCYSDEAHPNRLEAELGGITGPRFKHGGESRTGWRDLEITVTPEEVSVRWDGSKPFVLQRDAIQRMVEQYLRGRRLRFPDDPFFQRFQPKFGPRGGLGLHVRRGSASFRDVTVTPLSQ